MKEEEHTNTNASVDNDTTSLADQSASIVPYTPVNESCVVVISNLPKIPHTKVEKLTKVVLKLASKIGPVQTTDTFSGCMMPTDENGTTLGYCFVEYETPDTAKDCVEKLEGYEFDKKHTLSLMLYECAKQLYQFDSTTFAEPFRSKKPTAPVNTSYPTTVETTSKKDDEEDGVSPEYDADLDTLSILIQTRLWSHKPAVVANALQKIADLCDEKYHDRGMICDNQGAINDGSGGFAIPVAMKNNYNNVNVQIAGCRAIVMCGDENSSFCSTAMKYGAASTISLSMRKFSDNATLSAIGCQAMRVMIHCGPTLPFNFKTFVVVKALSKFGVQDTNVALHACDLIVGLCCYVRVSEELIDAGALEALGTIMRKFKAVGNKAHGKINEKAREAIKSLLAVTSVENRDKEGN